jgi:hypothetical protein
VSTHPAARLPSPVSSCTYRSPRDTDRGSSVPLRRQAQRLPFSGYTHGELVHADLAHADFKLATCQRLHLSLMKCRPFLVVWRSSGEVQGDLGARRSAHAHLKGHLRQRCWTTGWGGCQAAIVNSWNCTTSRRQGTMLRCCSGQDGDCRTRSCYRSVFSAK